MAAAAVVLVVFVVGIRRWIHHAQLELVPVIVAPSSDAAAVVNPPPAAIAARMAQDLRDVVQRPDRPRLAVLTFDDGPYPVESPALLAVLTQLHAPADFFLIGDDARTQPAIASRIESAGVEIGNHSLTHPEMPTLTYDAQSAEVAGGAAALREATGADVRYFRPPHGSYDASTLRAASAAGETVALWDIDPGDWRTMTPDEIVTAVLAQARAPAVIILHNGKDATIDALPRIVGAFRAMGFEFVTLSELQRRVPLDVINDSVKVRS
jgi:peptidoglycan/xylan/chitin deacetylase (PgdA/CDA1 family)